MGKRLTVDISGWNEMYIVREIMEEIIKRAQVNHDTRFCVKLKNTPKKPPREEPNGTIFVSEAWQDANWWEEMAPQDRGKTKEPVVREEAEDGKS